MNTETLAIAITGLLIVGYLVFITIRASVIWNKKNAMYSMDKEQLLSHLIEHKNDYIKTYRNEGLLGEENWRCLYAGIDDGSMTTYEIMMNHDFIY